MPKRDWSAPLDRVTFRCSECTRNWEAVPDLVEDDAENEHHPHRYYAHCRCGAQNQPQIAWQRNLMKAHQEATGPVTPEGKASSAANLAGHPTPHEVKLTRFNAMKHGLAARTATYFPARPDGYAFCKQCEVDRHWCSNQPACVKQLELFMQHHAAMDQRDPKHLGKIHADVLAAITAALQMCLQTVLADGVVIKSPRVELSREGVPVALTYVDNAGEKHFLYDYHSNPVFKPITDLITRLGLSMSDLGLTMKAIEDEDPAGAGMLQLDQASKETLDAFGKRMNDAMGAMQERLNRADASKRKDPVLIEHEANGDAT